jgi:hypothetical protein
MIDGRGGTNMLHDHGVILAAVFGSAVVITLLPVSLLVFLFRAAGISMVLAGVAALQLAGAFLLGFELVATGSVVFIATLESAG